MVTKRLRLVGADLPPSHAWAPWATGEEKDVHAPIADGLMYERLGDFEVVEPAADIAVADSPVFDEAEPVPAKRKGKV